MRPPVALNRSRAAALGLTLALHAVLVSWLLALRFDAPRALAEDPLLDWLPIPASPPPPPPLEASDLPPPEIAPVHTPPLPLPLPDVVPARPPDWSGTAREVAKDMTAAPSYRPFGETPKAPAGRPQEQYPPSIWPDALPRVGTTVVTPDGETIIWVSDYCFVSISSRSIALKDVHEGRNGVRTCVLAQFGDKKKARSDLFDPIKRPPPPQEPGCDEEGVGQSCGR
jgi:hypothetical protein